LNIKCKKTQKFNNFSYLPFTLCRLPVKNLNDLARVDAAKLQLWHFLLLHKNISLNFQILNRGSA
jgi:hypothetical protein